jgi:hypothetical protein
VQPGVVQGLAAILGSLDKDFEILNNLLLAAEVTETQRTQRVLKIFLAAACGVAFFVYVKIVGHRFSAVNDPGNGASAGIGTICCNSLAKLLIIFENTKKMAIFVAS